MNTPFTPEMADACVAQAVAYFKSGYNCAQSVVAAFAPYYDFTEEQAFRMSASFGGGIGRMRQTCGAACGMFLLAGLDCGATDGADNAGKSHNYAVVQRLARAFEEENGSLVCAELLGLKKPEGSFSTDVSSPSPSGQAPLGLLAEQKYSPQAEARTAQYYKKRPCAKMVETAARLFADYLLEGAK